MEGEKILTTEKKPKSPLLKKSYTMSDATYFSCIAALLAIVVLYTAYLLQGQTIAGGGNTVLRMDLYHQYGPLYAELYDRLKSGESLIYSWNSGLGSSFLGNLFNYCCSPFTLIMLFFDHVNIPDAIAIIILLKATAAAAAFTYFINRVYGTRKVSIAFGLLYAFCGYFVAYSWNVMWMDAFLMFPLVILGIVFIIRRGKPGLYLFAMTYTMVTNYYMAYMVCILSILYFLYYYFSNFKLSDKLSKPKALAEGETEKDTGFLSEIRNSRFMMTGIKFALSSFLAFMLAAFALLPVFFILKGSSATNSSGFPSLEEWKEYFNIFDFLANHLANVTPTIRSSGNDVLPNIYCGVMTVMLIPAFLFNKNIQPKKKILTCFFLAFFYAGFVLNALNYVWHGMHYPNDLPYRYSFAYSFLLLAVAYEVFLHIKEYSYKFFVGTGIGMLAFVVLIQELGSKNIGKMTLMINIAFIVIYVLLLSYFANGKKSRETLSMALVCIVVCELIVSNSFNYVMSQKKEHYIDGYDEFREISAMVDDYEATYEDGDLFFREEKSKLLTRMDASWLDYNGISIFSSMAYETTSKLHRQLGLFSNGINSYTYNPQTAVYNSMFGIKYLYDKDNLIDTGEMYTFIGSDSTNTYDAYLYNYPLPLAFSVDEQMLIWSDSGSVNPFVNQNQYFELATGVADVLENVVSTQNVSTTGGLYVNDSSIENGSYSFTCSSTSESTATTTFTATQAGEYCIYFKSPSCLGYNISADNGFNTSTRYSTGSMTYYSVNVGHLDPGQSVRIVITYPSDSSTGTANVFAVRLNEEKFKEGYNKILANGTYEITDFEETYIKGDINVTNDNALLYTSIPYDKSWKISIDGVALSEDEVLSVADALLAFKLTKGQHTIEFTYEPAGLQTGLILTCVGVLIVLVWIALYLINKKKGGSLHFFEIADDTDMHTFEETEEEQPAKSVKKHRSVLFGIIGCYLSFGIYYFVWKARLFNELNAFCKKHNSEHKNGSAIAFLFLPVYAPLWIAKRSKSLAEIADKFGIKIKFSYTLRLLLGLFGGGYFALGELQNDLNYVRSHISSAKKKQAAEQAVMELTQLQQISESEENADEKPVGTEEPTATIPPTEKKYYYSKVTPVFMYLITVVIVVVMFFAHLLGIELLGKALIDEESTAQTTETTLITTGLITSDPSTTQTTSETETTTETTTQPTTEETTVLDNEQIANAARTLLKFTGIELTEDNALFMLVGAVAREGDSVETLCERHGVDYASFGNLIYLLNDLSESQDELSAGTMIILPMIAENETTAEDDSTAVG